MSLEVAEKWGFGMAPPKQKAQRERITACEVVLGILVTRNARTNPDQMLACLSIVKGLFNRVARQDQWDWFTVAGQFGYPSCRLAKTIADELATLRTAIRDGDDQASSLRYATLNRLPTIRCLNVFLGRLQIREEVGAGWIYILSTRQMPDLLKIGMTTRSVETRVNEINSATGVAIPFGVRRCWRVLKPQEAEKAVHTALSEHRVRIDREFFRVDFFDAQRLIDEALTLSHFEIRTLNALAGLLSGA